MSVLINGMAMPTSCDDCDFIQHSCPKDWCYITEKNLPCNCPLIHIPPHGRLIDADALIKPKNQHVDVLADEWYVMVRTIETAPTIIEAEGESK